MTAVLDWIVGSLATYVLLMPARKLKTWPIVIWAAVVIWPAVYYLQIPVARSFGVACSYAFLADCIAVHQAVSYRGALKRRVLRSKR